jgi:hypothetical protein
MPLLVGCVSRGMGLAVVKRQAPAEAVY